MVRVGDTAPAFNLKDQDGVDHRLSDYRGRWVLLYFYPKDMTSGCIKEACMIRDSFLKFENVQAQVFGISADSVESHKKFAAEYALPFPLLADEEKTMIEAYGVWGEKNIFGKTVLGIRRMSFLVDPEGKIRKIYEKVKPEIHAEEVLADLETFGA